MRIDGSLGRGQRRIFAARAAGRLCGRVARAVAGLAGAARHVAWYAAYLVDGRRGACPDEDEGG